MFFKQYSWISLINYIILNLDCEIEINEICIKVFITLNKSYLSFSYCTINVCLKLSIDYTRPSTTQIVNNTKRGQQEIHDKPIYCSISFSIFEYDK